MSNFRVELNDKTSSPRAYRRPPAPFDEYGKRRPLRQRPLLIAAGAAAALIAVALVAFLAYYQSLKKTPQYSLALLVDAAKNDDKKEVDTLVDINSVVDDFVPQIVNKAVELYGRGQSPQVIAKARKIADPLMPAVKDRARAELPRVIRSRTERFGYVPFFAMVIGADQYLGISINGDIATVTSKVRDHPLEMKMKRNGDRWQIVGVSDDTLATDIARTIGQELMAIAANGGKGAADQFGIGNLSDLLKQAEGLVK